MNKKEYEEKHGHRDVFANDAKSIVDMLFDSNLLSSELTRSDMDAIEEYIRYCMNSKLDINIKAMRLADSINEKKGSKKVIKC